ncbi:C40 family peptidase [Nocardia sp. NPDC052566]|uniref:C40 family peptidase n=1 Tax=Nocardia sp. NPDC052566 TaxID=3364330 RepID=UPI0037C90DB4
MDSGKTIAAAALSLPLAVLLLLLLIVVGVAPQQSCTTPLSVDGNSVAGGGVAGLNESQLRLARNGVAIGRQRGMPESVILAELAAQSVESGFRNLANAAVPESLSAANDGVGANLDSVGPHQMRASVWGSVGIATLMDPPYQINWFYDQAVSLGARAERMSPAEIAQAIERSRPNAYAGHMDLAQRLLARFADLAPGPTRPSAAGQQRAAGCGTDGSGAPLTAQASEFGRKVIEHASRWIGTPYVWGGGDASGPTAGGFDCSGLTLYAIYQASGGQIRLPHYTQAQQDHPTAQTVPWDKRAPGDLIFFTQPGDSDSHHVGILLDGDRLLHAPQSGQTVTITPLSAWQGERKDARRYGPSTAAPTPA